MKVWKRIAVVGVSGSGKTSLICRFLESNSAIATISAGRFYDEAIVDLPSSASWEQIQIAIGEKLVEAAESIEAHILFDAHCVIGLHGKLVAVPFGVFQTLGLAGMVLISRSAKEIYSSLYNDTRRLRQLRTVEQIQAEINSEFVTAKAYSDRLALPFYEVKNFDGFTRGIANILVHM
jgi:adenylate kinase